MESSTQQIPPQPLQNVEQQTDSKETNTKSKIKREWGKYLLFGVIAFLVIFLALGYFTNYLLNHSFTPVALNNSTAFVEGGQDRNKVYPEYNLNNPVIKTVYKGKLDRAGYYFDERVENNCSLVADDTLFMYTSNGRLKAIDIANGKTKWNSKVGLGGSGCSGLSSRISIASNKVFIVDHPGRIYAFDERTGKKIWDHSTRFYLAQGKFGEYKVFYEIDSDFLVKDNIGYFTSRDNYITAIDVNTGEVVWEYNDGTGFNFTAIKNNTLYAYGRKLYAFDLNSRNVLWQTDLVKDLFSDHQLTISSIAPVISDDSIYITGMKSDFFLGTFNIISIDALTGIKTWDSEVVARPDHGYTLAEMNIGIGSTLPTVDDENVYIKDEDQYLHIFDKQTGAKKRVIKIVDGQSSTPVIAGDKLYLNTARYENNECINTLNTLDASTGDIENSILLDVRKDNPKIDDWNEKLCIIRYSPIIDKTGVYVFTYDKVFLVTNDNSGTVESRVAEINSSPEIAPYSMDKELKIIDLSTEKRIEFPQKAITYCVIGEPGTRNDLIITTFGDLNLNDQVKENGWAIGGRAADAETYKNYELPTKITDYPNPGGTFGPTFGVNVVGSGGEYEGFGSEVKSSTGKITINEFEGCRPGNNFSFTIDAILSSVNGKSDKKLKAIGTYSSVIQKSADVKKELEK